jgi:hypothetical protein
LFNPFFASLLLTFEAQRVIELRLVRLAWVGQEGWAEMNSMVFEKIAATTEATTMLLTGGTPATWLLATVNTWLQTRSD